MTDCLEFLVAALTSVYSPRTGLNAWQWGEREIRLGSKESIDFQGKWDSEFTSYVRFVMEFATGDFGDDIEFLPGFSRDDEWRELIIMKSSQLGFTLAYLILIAYWIAEVRQNAIFAIDSMEEARRISKSRLQPMLQACDKTKAKLDESEDEQSNLTLYLLACTIYLMGSYGKGTWRNKSASLAVLDELDAYKVDDEVEPIDAARNRLKAVEGAKLIAGGAPETEHHPTAKEEKTGTRHRCFLPCPHCDHYQQLVWENVRFSHCKDMAGEYDLPRVLAETYYECELCHKPIYEDQHKAAMLRRRKWRQTNPKPFPRRLSLQISDLYSPFAEARWGVIAVEFIQAQGNPGALKSWRKNRMGEPSKIEQDQRTGDHLDKLRGYLDETGVARQYLRGTIPVQPCVVMVTSDVQGDVKKWVKVGFLPTGAMFVIDWGQTLAFEELSMVAADPVPIGIVPVKSDVRRWQPSDGWDGPVCHAQMGVIDEGYAGLLKETREFAQRTILGGEPCPFFTSKGRGGFQVRLTVQESMTEALGHALRVYHYSDDDIKKLLYIARIARRVKPVPNVEPGPPIHFPSFLDPEFKAELCSEQLTSEKVGGLTQEKWKKKDGVPNDWGDALKLPLVLWHVIAPLFRDWKADSETDATPPDSDPDEIAEVA